MLRICLFVLTMCLFAGQVLAYGEVYVDLDQTGPTDNGKVRYHVKRNITTTFKALGHYDGEPPLWSEEKLLGTSWAYEVTPVDDHDDPVSSITCNPKSGRGNSVTITAKGSESGAYFIKVKMTLTFKIKYKTNDIEFERTHDVTNSTLIAFNIDDDDLRIRLEPTIDFTGRSYTKFGLCETGSIKVESARITGEAVLDLKCSSSDTSVCRIKDRIGFNMRRNPGYVTIKVSARLSGEPVSGEVALTSVAPSTMTVIKTGESDTIANTKKEVGAAFTAAHYIGPMNVCFDNLYVKEKNSEAVTTGSQDSWTNKTYNGITLSGITFSEAKKNYWVSKSISAVGRDMDVKKGTLKWIIPVEYQGSRNSLYRTRIENTCLVEFDGKGGCRLTKKGNDGDEGGIVERVPSDIDVFLTDPKNYQGTFKYK